MALQTEVSYQDLRSKYAHLSRAPLDDAFWPSISSLTGYAVSLAQHSLKTHVPELFAAHSGVAVCCTGSDSRLEKCGLGSPVECIVITPKAEINSAQAAVIEKIVKLCVEEAPLFFPIVESKRLDTDLVATCDLTKGTPPRDKVIPTRAFDALFLGGENEIFQQYKSKVLTEIVQRQVDLRLFRDDFQKAAFQSLRQELSNSPRKKPLLTLDSGTVFYEKSGGRGLKHDALRAVQYTIAHIIFSFLQEGRLKIEEVSFIPQTVIGRLEWLKQKKMTPLLDHEYVRLEQLYTRVSYWYAQLNAKAIEENQDFTTMVLDPRELRPVLQETHDLCRKMKE